MEGRKNGGEGKNRKNVKKIDIDGEEYLVKKTSVEEFASFMTTCFDLTSSLIHAAR